jgi:hypothetical protein
MSVTIHVHVMGTTVSDLPSGEDKSRFSGVWHTDLASDQEIQTLNS